MSFDKLEDLRQRKKKVELGGGIKRIEKQHSNGKLTARERINLLFDEGTFVELDAFVKHRCVNFGMEKLDRALQARPHMERSESPLTHPGQRRHLKSSTSIQPLLAERSRLFLPTAAPHPSYCRTRFPESI